MQHAGYLRVVSIDLAEQSRWDELHSCRELIKQWPAIERHADKSAKVLAAIEFEQKVLEHLTRHQIL